MLPYWNKFIILYWPLPPSFAQTPGEGGVR